MESITRSTPSRSSSHFMASITPSVASLALFFDSASERPKAMNSLKSIFVAIPGVSIMSSSMLEPLALITTPSFLMALRVSWGTGEISPKLSPSVQSCRILLARVVFPALGGPYNPILALFFLNILLIQDPRLPLRLLNKPMSYLFTT